MKQPTCVSLVFEFLVRADDFKSVAEIQLGTGCNVNQVTAALFHLHKYKAADKVSVSNEPRMIHRDFWFVTPETDTRITHVDEREPEKGPRNRKIKLKKKEVK